MPQKINLKEDLKIDKRIIKYLWVILILLFIDQTIKLIVYKNFALHEETKIISDWFRIRLELNDGIAFANPFINETDRYFKISTKILLSIVLFICLIFFINKRGPKILLYGLALCFAGSIGNLIDRVFHGVLLSNSLDIYSTKWFHGCVIDMFYLPLFEIKLPNWFPFRAGENYLFFEPVFNFSDLVLLTGAVMAFVELVKTGKKKQG
ncbi:MAG: signal peptidase II [Bacteroidia bacterium]|nr:signal peptidase II [Bacteroidia bacterium]